MSPDEIIILLVASGVAVWGWGKWYACLANVWPPERDTRNRLWLALLPVASLLIIYGVISTIAAFDVVGDAAYVFFYIVLGLAWLVPVRGLMFLIFDLSWRDDVLERNNTAAALSICGGVLGVTIIYAGANVGDGPGWWVVVFTGVIATAIWFALVYGLQRYTGLFERITIERDYTSGVRALGYMLASGVVLGRAAAGDWISAESTIIDFWQAWPVLVLFGLALWIERISSSEYEDDSASRRAWLWGVTYILLALAALMFFPPLSQNPWYGNLSLFL